MIRKVNRIIDAGYLLGFGFELRCKRIELRKDRLKRISSPIIIPDKCGIALFDSTDN